LRHWAFQSPVASLLPVVRDMAWSRSPLDRFVLAKLESQRIEPSPQADRQVLIRRLFLDLLGLPPETDDVESFVAQDGPDAWERAVDRALASPHFGERWGRHWLDLARYADSDGYEKDKPRPLAWRYRQWVIAAVNQDQPYDEFTRDQLAGDLLLDGTIEQRVAVGFQRNTLHNTEGGADPEEDRVKKTVDRTNTLGAVWLGLTVGCTQCHSHKYDPLTQREYYSLYAFFNSLQEVDVDAPQPADLERLARQQETFRKEQQTLEGAVREYEATQLAAAQTRWESETAPHDELPDPIAAIVAQRLDDRTEPQRQQLAEFFMSIDVELNRRRQAVAAHETRQPKLPAELKTQSVSELAKARATHIQLRGDFLSPGEPVTRGVFEVLPPLEPRGSQPDRLDLASWLVSPAHPLTARVAVNRYWQHLFGRGLVASVDDFGKQGDPPTHPELLDWLAIEFQSHGWSTKRVLREMLTSTAYRQSSAPRRDLASIDPENTLVARQSRRRVEAEIIRDLAMAASGLLDRRLGGPSVRPRQPAEHSSLTYAGSANWAVSKGGDAFRRGMYTFFQRTSPYPMLMTFDSPDSNETCTRRSHSNTPLQSLTLWNDPVFVEAAQRLGRRVVEATAIDADESADSLFRRRLDTAFLLSLGRRPSSREVSTLAQLHARQLELSRGGDAKVTDLIGSEPLPSGADAVEMSGWVAIGRVLLNLDEFLTRE